MSDVNAMRVEMDRGDDPVAIAANVEYEATAERVGAIEGRFDVVRLRQESVVSSPLESPPNNSADCYDPFCVSENRSFCAVVVDSFATSSSRRLSGFGISVSVELFLPSIPCPITIERFHLSVRNHAEFLQRE